MSTVNYSIYQVSDSTNFLASDAIVKMATTQFAGMSSRVEKIPNVKTKQEAKDIVQVAAAHKPCIVVFSTPDPEVKQAFLEQGELLDVECLDIFSPIVNAFSRALDTEPVYREKCLWQLDGEYYRKIKAVEFAINNDDGKSVQALQKADVVLIGVSRTSKTPLSIYLAYHNYFVVNIPLISTSEVPKHLYQLSSRKVVGLTISPGRLNQIRSERNTNMGVNAGSHYSDMNYIIEELEFADRVMKKIGCPVIDVSNKAVEETAEVIMKLIKHNHNYD